MKKTQYKAQLNAQIQINCIKCYFLHINISEKVKILRQINHLKEKKLC